MNKPINEPKHLVLICIDNDDILSQVKSIDEFLQLGIYLSDKDKDITLIMPQMRKDQRIIEDIGTNCTIIRLPILKMKPDELIEEAVGTIQHEVEKSALIHSMNWMSGACGFKLSKMYGIRHLNRFYSLGRENLKDRYKMTDKEIFRDNWELKIFSSAEFLISPSAYLAKSFLELYPKAFHKKVIVIPPGVDHEIFKPRPWQQDEPG